MKWIILTRKDKTPNHLKMNNCNKSHWLFLKWEVINNKYRTSYFNSNKKIATWLIRSRTWVIARYKLRNKNLMLQYNTNSLLHKTKEWKRITPFHPTKEDKVIRRNILIIVFSIQAKRQFILSPLLKTQPSILHIFTVKTIIETRKRMKTITCL